MKISIRSEFDQAFSFYSSLNSFKQPGISRDQFPGIFRVGLEGIDKISGLNRVLYLLNFVFLHI